MPFNDEPTGAVRVNAKTWILVSAVSFAYAANLIGVVASGLLANGISTLFNAPGQGVWLGISLNIFTATLGPPVSRIADMWGRKWPLVFTLLNGTIGSIVASRAEDINTVIAGFCLIGIATASQPLLHAVVSEVLPRNQRPIAQGLLNAASGVGAFVAICMGGALLRYSEYDQYRIYMYVLAGLFFVAAAAILLLYNPPRRELEDSLSFKQKLGSMDWIGTALMIPGLVLFSLALGWSENPYQWDDAHILAPFIIGVVFLFAFGIYQWKFTKDGLFHHGLFRKNRSFPIILVIIFAEGVAFFASNQYFAFQISVLLGQDLLIAGLHYGVMFMAATVFAMLGGWYSTKRKSVKSIAILGMAFMTIFFICMAAVSRPSTPDAAYWVLAIVLGVGIGFILPTSMVIAQMSTPLELIAEASALLLAIRSTGATVGLAINSAIFSGSMGSEIPSRVAAAVLPLGLPPTSIGPLIGALQSRVPEAIAAVPGATPPIIGAAGEAILEAYAVSFRWAWVSAGCFCAVGTILAFFLVNPKDQFTAHIDAPAEQAVVAAQEKVEGVEYVEDRYGDKADAGHIEDSQRST